MAFVFVPRIVSKHAKPWPGIARVSPSPSPSASSSPDITTDSEPGDEYDDDDEANTHDKGKGREKAIQPTSGSKQSQDIASLISLALSDYNIWLDPDLRCKLDACPNDETCPDGAGFVPINYLLRRAPFRGSLQRADGTQPELSEIQVVKALRTHANHVLEVRMRLPSSSSVWYGTGKTSRKKDVGGYEVRRKSWASLPDRLSRGWTRTRWDDMTTYVEGIPPSYRTIGGITRFVESLLSSESETTTDARLSVEAITLPPHYLDKAGDTPKCKGYALIVLSAKSHAETLRRAWPWKRVAANDDVSQVVKEAHKYGFRSISKARWDALNEEYIVYKQSIVDAMMHTEMHLQGEQEQRGDDSEFRTRRTLSDSPYPFDCLVFVRNVHPETNKTTLKALFGRAFQDDVAPQGPALDYVDFNKGMDTCYVRLASPECATHLIAYFNARGLAQVDGLDTMGHTPVRNDKPIMIEMVQGKKEQVYWDKVPEKVRSQAVDKAIKTVGNATVRRNGQKRRRRDSDA